MNVKRCTRCVMPETVPGVTYDEDGVCNYCLSYSPADVIGKEALDEIVESLRGKGAAYDCIVPISGGRDSTYVLYAARALYDLRTLAVHYNSEFVEEQSIANIRNACDALDCELISVRSKRDIATKMVRANLKTPTTAESIAFCAACNYGYHAAPYRLAVEHQVPMIWWGVTKDEALIGDMVKEARRSMSGKKSKYLKLFRPSFYAGQFHRVRQRMEFRVPGNSIFSRAHAKLNADGIREFSLFRFIRWDREEIEDAIINKLGWRKPPGYLSTWRTDCKLHVVKDLRCFKTCGCSSSCWGYTKLHQRRPDDAGRSAPTRRARHRPLR